MTRRPTPIARPAGPEVRPVTARAGAPAKRPARPAPAAAPARRRPARGGRGTRATGTSADTVSSTSAQRFAARVRSRRRRRIGIAVLAVAAVAGLVWTVLYSPPATLRTVHVAGTTRVDAANVRSAAVAEIGRPLLFVDVGAVAARVRRDRLVEGVSVRRHWPSALVITVRERSPVAAVPGGPGVQLVDRDGVVIGGAAAPPPGLPVLRVDLQQAGPGALRACLAVSAALPESLSRQVHQMGADSAESVWLVLLNGSRVVWGGADSSARKAEVLLALLQGKPASVYDVSAPDAPAVTRRHH